MTVSERLFVYGTLMPGESRWVLLSVYAGGDPQQDRISGRLVDTGAGYPGMVGAEPGRWVHGWVVTLDATESVSAFRTLDKIEGVDVGLFARELRTTLSGHSCWVYRYMRDPTGLPDLEGLWVDPTRPSA